MLCIWRECNSRNFEDCVKLVVELKDIMFKILYEWITTTSSSRFSNFLEFLDLCCFSFPKWVFLLYAPYVLRLRPCHSLLRLYNLSKKKKKYFACRHIFYFYFLLVLLTLLCVRCQLWWIFSPFSVA